MSIYKTFGEFLWSKGTGRDTRNSLVLSLVSYWIGVTAWVQIVPKPAGGVLPSGVPNSVQSCVLLLTEIISGIVLYDAIFFAIHWAMHECRSIPFLSCIHKEHHREYKCLEARHVLRHSLFDGILQVLVNITVQRHTPWGTVKSRLARALHNVIVTWMLTESHSTSPTPYVFRRFCIGVKEHRQHHLFGGDSKVSCGGLGRFHRYQQFFGYLDDMRAKIHLRLKIQ